MSPELPIQPKGQNVGNYLRARRKKAGLSQRELGRLLGYAGEGAVSRHEQTKTMPPLRVAIAYEIIFNNHVSAIFRDLREKTNTTIEQRLLDFEKELQGKAAKGNHAPHIDQKLAWLSERRNAPKS